MNLLDDLPAAHDGDAGDDHAILRLHVSPTALRDDGGALQDDDGAHYAPQAASQSLRATRSRRKIGKGIQLILLRKYVQRARQLNRLPDRTATEQLLEQGYDEFYYQGGNLNEPRLGYAAFLKLVRNRRCEVARQTRGSGLQQRGTRRHQKEQAEIRALIDELEHVRQAQSHNANEYEAVETSAGGEQTDAVATETTVPMLSDSSSMIGDTTPDGGVSAGDLPEAETYSTVMPAPNSDDVAISRAKLDLMLRMAQETLIAQKKILEEVRAMEQRVADIH